MPNVRAGEQNTAVKLRGGFFAIRSKDNAVVSTPANYQNLSLFELQKRSAENQDQIAQTPTTGLQFEVGMHHPPLHYMAVQKSLTDAVLSQARHLMRWEPAIQTVRMYHACQLVQLEITKLCRRTRSL